MKKPHTITAEEMLAAKLAYQSAKHRSQVYDETRHIHGDEYGDCSYGKDYYLDVAFDRFNETWDPQSKPSISAMQISAPILFKLFNKFEKFIAKEEAMGEQIFGMNFEEYIEEYLEGDVFGHFISCYCYED